MPNAALIRETGAVHRGVELLHKSPDFFYTHSKQNQLQKNLSDICLKGFFAFGRYQ